MLWAEFSFSIRHLHSADQLEIQKAFDVGERAHVTQRRQSGEPYFTHPIAVARILANWGADKDTIIAGLLHDTVEDTPLTLAEIRREFGRTVATMIDALTKLEGEDIAGKPNLNEQIETLRKMFTLMQQDVRIMVIKLADRLHNMQTVSFTSPAKQVRVARETMDVYVKIADRLCMRDTRDELEGLALSVLEPELHANLLKVTANNELLAESCIKRVQESITAKFPGLPVAFKHEKKTWSKRRQQFDIEGEVPTGALGVNVAIICPDVSTCYETLGALHQIWQREALTFEDYINVPVINGYKGLHTTIILDKGERFRCKIRTPEMDEYAHRGITMYCFNNQSRGVFSYLPWAKHVAEIAADTTYHSAEFWDSLQNDILQESIMIYNPEGKNVLVPRGSTVLDGAYFLLREQANWTSKIRMNGKEVSFRHPLEVASTLEIDLADHPTVQREWLQIVQTGSAIALIRQQLATAPRAAKIELGRDLLDLALQQSNRIHLEELSPSVIEGYLGAFGVSSVDDLLERIAEGKQDALEVANKLFAERRKKGGLFQTSAWILHADVPHASEDRMFAIIRAFPNARISFEHNRESSHLTIHLSLTQNQVQELEAAVSEVLPHDVWTLRSINTNRVLVIAVAGVIAIWGLDPVVASWILQDISPYDLTFIRAITFFAASSILYASQLLFVGRHLRWLNPFNPTLIACGIALFLTALFSYVALTGISALEYILLIVGTMFTTVMCKVIVKNGAWQPIARSLIIITTGTLVAGFTLGYTPLTLLAGVGSALGFSLYSELSQRYQHQAAPIRARYPAFLFWLSCVGLAMSGFILPYTNYYAIEPMKIVQITLFVLFFSVLPYSLYFEITRRFESKLLDRMVPLVTIITLAGEILLLQSFTPLFTLPPILLFIAHYYGMFKKRQMTA